AHVERRDDHHARFGDRERGQLVQRCGRTVVVDGDPVEGRRGGTARADGREVLLRDPDGLLHLLFGLKEGFFGHCGAPGTTWCSWLGGPAARRQAPDGPTMVPIFSPRTARRMLPWLIRSNTTMGRPLSMHRLTAVASM